MDTARTQSCAISAVQATHESKLPYYGAVGGRLAPNQQGLYVIEQVLEKPTPTEAEQKIIVPGLRTGHYLCFFGMHVLTPLIMDLLEQQLKQVAPSQRLSLSPALSQLAQRERYLACELQGRRFDIGIRYGHLIAQLALAIQGQDRDEVLSHLVELLALDTPTRKSQA
jgi:UTP--glucose-1-phosphate uridylyltransferase